MKLRAADWQRLDGMARLLAALGADQGETRYVGGCVRDTLLDLPVSDIDLATRLDPHEVIRRLKKAHIKAVPTGLAHGTITAILGDGPVEVTTLRRDLVTDGRRATIAFTEDWKEDAARRDFTINALSADPLSLEIFDYFGGRDDLAERRLRFIGDPLTRIAEDHLRILRFFRFHARFGRGEPDQAALDACTARANDLMALSRERIADELLKLLGMREPGPTVALMAERGIFRPVLPEIGSEGVAELARLLEREKTAGVAPDALRRLAALLPADPAQAEAIAARLRLSNKATKRIAKAARRQSSDPADPFILAYTLGAAEAVDRLLLGHSDPARVGALEGWQRPRLPLGGGDLVAMGLAPGPAVARALQAIERGWIKGGFSPNLETVRALARAAVDQALRDRQ